MNVKVKILYTPSQVRKIKKHHKKGESVSIRLSNDQIFVSNGTDTEVSPEIYKKLVSAKKTGTRGYVLTMDKSMTGGVLPLIPILSAIAPALLSGIATSGTAFATTKLLNTLFPDKKGQGLIRAGTKKGDGLVRAGTKRGQGLRLAGSSIKKKDPKK